MTLPNAIGIGAQRAATTWVYECLREHPEVFVPAIKEVNFFGANFDKGVAWYEAYFSAAGAHPVVAEITPNYLHTPEAIERIRQVLPDARLFVILREPISRAVSAYQLFRGRDRSPWSSFAEACAPQSRIFRMSLYADALIHVFANFPRDRVKVMLYDDIEHDPQVAIRELFTFLSVDPAFEPVALHKTFNRFVYPRTQKLLARIGLGWLPGAVKKTHLGDWIKNRHRAQRRTAHEPIDPRLLADLRERFRPDVLRVQDLIGRDLSAWLVGDSPATWVVAAAEASRLL